MTVVEASAATVTAWRFRLPLAGTDVHTLHRRVMEQFPPEPVPERRVLWRPIPGGVLVQTTHPPAACAEEVQLAAEPGRQYRVDIVANPTMAPSRRTSRNTRTPLHGDDAAAWLARKLAPAGPLADVQVHADTAWFGHRPATGRVTVHVVRMTGLLECADPQPLVEMMRLGVGRGRGYGCGLLLADVT